MRRRRPEFRGGSTSQTMCRLSGQDHGYGERSQTRQSSATTFVRYLLSLRRRLISLAILLRRSVILAPARTATGQVIVSICNPQARTNNGPQSRMSMEESNGHLGQMAVIGAIACLEGYKFR